jgi:protein SPT2
MSWRGEKADHLQKSRDFSFLHDDDRSQKEAQRSRPARASGERVPENQEKLLRLKALERQRADKQKKQYVESSSPDEREERRETERSAGAKRGPPSSHDNFGSFFGKVEKVVAKRVVDEQRAREIAARERRLAEAEKAAKVKADGRNGSDARHSARPGSSSGSRPAAKPKLQNPVTVKAQKLKDNRDYSFLFSDEPPSKAEGAEGRGARPQPSKASKEWRPGAEGAVKQKAAGSQSQKPRPASNGNGAVRPSSGQGPSSAEARKALASRPASAGKGDNNGRAPRYDSERRSEKESRHASGGRAERDSRPERDARYESERRAEAGRGLGSSRAPSAGKGAGVERAAPKGPTSKYAVVAADRDKRANQERPTSAGRPKATNHDRPVARESSTMKSSSVTRVSQSSGQRMSQAGNAGSRERVVQKSTTETRVSQSVHRAAEGAGSSMKRKMVGEAARKPVIAAKSNEGRRVDRSRYGGSDSESEMRRLVAGVPRGPQAAGARVPKPSAGPSRRLSEEPARRKTMDAPVRRKAAEEPLRRRSSEEVMRSRPAAGMERKRQRQPESESESESESEGGPARKSGVSSIIQKLFRYNPNKYADLDDEDDRNMETSFKHIQAEERRSARLAREEDEREQELIEAEERAERERKLRRQKMGK